MIAQKRSAQFHLSKSSEDMKDTQTGQWSVETVDTCISNKHGRTVQIGPNTTLKLEARAGEKVFALSHNVGGQPKNKYGKSIHETESGLMLTLLDNDAPSNKITMAEIKLASHEIPLLKAAIESQFKSQ